MGSVSRFLLATDGHGERPILRQAYEGYRFRRSLGSRLFVPVLACNHQDLSDLNFWGGFTITRNNLGSQQSVPTKSHAVKTLPRGANVKISRVHQLHFPFRDDILLHHTPLTVPGGRGRSGWKS